MHWRTCASIIAAMLALAAVLLPAARDEAVRLTCATGPAAPQCPAGSHGVLLVAKAAVLKDTGSANHDVTFKGVDSSYTQVMAFRTGYKPAYKKAVVWNGASNPLELKFEDRVDLPIRVWIVCPDRDGNCSKPLTSSRETYLKDFVTNANSVLNSERVGIRLVPANNILISDNASTRSGASDFGKFNSRKCPELLSWATSDPGNRWLDATINIFVVSKVDRLGSNGYNCSNGTKKLVVVGATVTWKTILHETGHSLSLIDLPRKDVEWDGDQKENFMRSYSNRRKYFTEAEIFRIWVNDISAVVGVSPPQRNCGLSDADGESERPPCPQLVERVWPER